MFQFVIRIPIRLRESFTCILNATKLGYNVIIAFFLMFTLFKQRKDYEANFKRQKNAVIPYKIFPSGFFDKPVRTADLFSDE